MTLNNKLSSSKLPQISTKDTLSFFRDVIKEKNLLFTKIDRALGRKPFINEEFQTLINDRIIDLQLQIKDALLVFGASHQLATSLSLRFLGFHREMIIRPSLQRQTAKPEKPARVGGNT